MAVEIPLPPLFSPGQVVVSLKGHDRGRLYLVLALKGDRRLLLADGRSHGYVDAKLKNTKHVQVLGRAFDQAELEEILSGGGGESECKTVIRKLIAGWADRKRSASKSEKKAIGGEDA